MLAPPSNWWKPLGRQERNWLTVAFVWCIFLTAMMPIWLIYGRQNVPATTFRTTPEAFKIRVDEWVAKYQTGTDKLGGVDVPVVTPEAGGDAYILARQFQWYPILQIKKGETYRLHLSSLDVQHGFWLQPTNLNMQVLPDYDYVITITPKGRDRWPEANLALQKLMSSYMGDIRSEEGRKIGLYRLQELVEEWRMAAPDAHETMRALEVENLATIARACLTAALERGASSHYHLHFRVDHPQWDPPEWKKWILIRQLGDQIQIEHRPIEYRYP